jgi:hypothetical protein
VEHAPEIFGSYTLLIRAPRASVPIAARRPDLSQNHHENKELQNMKIRNLKKGDFFTKKPLDNPKESQVWMRGEYDRSQKKYECTRFDDMCTSCYLPGDRDVYTEFTF